MQDFGSPNAGDATAKKEKRILNGSRRRLGRLERAEKIINRPIGSKVDLSEEEQITDWQALVSNPQSLLDKVGQRSLAIGPKRAALEMLKWDKEMQEKANGN